MPLTVNSSLVNSDLTNFPVLVYLNESFHWEQTQDNLNDLRFSDSSNNTLSFEIDTYYINLNASLWVKLLEVNSSSDTVFYMYFGNPVCSSGENITDVWDSDFVMVHHMNDETTSTILDSTQYDNDGSKTAANEPIQANSLIGKAQEYDGTDDTINCGNNASIESFLTLEFYMNTQYPLDAVSYIIKKAQFDTYTASYAVAFNNVNQRLYAYVYGFSDTSVHSAKTSWNNDTWYYCVFRMANNNHSWWIDGSLDISQGNLGSLTTDSDDLFICDGVSSQDPFYGFVDEVRLSNVTRSEAYITTSYESGRNNLLSYGVVEIYESGVYGSDLSVEDVFGVVFLFAVVALSLSLVAMYKKGR